MIHVDDLEICEDRMSHVVYGTFRFVEWAVPVFPQVYWRNSKVFILGKFTANIFFDDDPERKMSMEEGHDLTGIVQALRMIR